MLMDAVRFAAKPRRCDAGAAQADTDTPSLVAHAERNTDHDDTLDDARWAIPALSTAVHREMQVSIRPSLPFLHPARCMYASVCISREPRAESRSARGHGRYASRINCSWWQLMHSAASAGTSPAVPRRMCSVC